jgi:alcohol dehydrogenase class IV
MKISRKIQCRTYQTGLKLALPFLPYRKPMVEESVRNIPLIINASGCCHCLIVTDIGIRKLGLLEQLEAALQAAAMPYTVYDKTMPNPTSDNIEEALVIYNSEGCDCLIGFGGGSSMDCAKGIGARLAKPDKSLRQMKGVQKVGKKLPLLIAIPTTAGSGSESTIAAVITDSSTLHKYAINDFSLIPQVAVLDPSLTLSLPPMLTATTGLDALTHAIEAYIGRSTTHGTRKDAKAAVRLIFGNLTTAYDDGSNLEARGNMLRAAFYAGCAFTKSYVGYVHAIAHSLGGEYNIPHGLANAVLLPMMLEAYGSAIHGKLKDLAIAIGLADKSTPASQAASMFIGEIRKLEKHCGIGNTLPGIHSEDIPRLARYADEEANPLYPVPVLMDSYELEKFYYMLLG